MTEQDPTRIDIRFDPTLRRMEGWAAHGPTYFDVPFISQITENLWVGGCKNGLVLPEFIDHVISLYPWEQYEIHHDATRQEFRAYDSIHQPGGNMKTFVEAAKAAQAALEDGKTVLIYCQAGLNRSSLAAGLTLLNMGFVESGAAAVELLREKRSPAALCNPSFEEYLVQKG